jgi:hypothetical protein
MLLLPAGCLLYPWVSNLASKISTETKPPSILPLIQKPRCRMRPNSTSFWGGFQPSTQVGTKRYTDSAFLVLGTSSAVASKHEQNWTSTTSFSWPARVLSLSLSLSLKIKTRSRPLGERRMVLKLLRFQRIKDSSSPRTRHQ